MLFENSSMFWKVMTKMWRIWQKHFCNTDPAQNVSLKGTVSRERCCVFLIWSVSLGIKNGQRNHLTFLQSSIKKPVYCVDGRILLCSASNWGLWRFQEKSLIFFRSPHQAIARLWYRPPLIGRLWNRPFVIGQLRYVNLWLADSR